METSNELFFVEQYLAFEEKAAVRHEYWNGHLRQITGDSLEHSFLAHQLSRFLSSALDDLPYFVAGGNVAVRLEESNAFVYPDLVAWRGDTELSVGQQKILHDPLIIAEVLSPASFDFDTGHKLHGYICIPSLTDYLIVSPHRVRIQHYSRRTDKEWYYNDYLCRDENVKFASLGIEISVGDIYRKLDVPEGLRILGIGDREIAGATY